MNCPSEATLQFIRCHADDDVRKLALSSGGKTDVDLTYALQQIAGRQKAQQKLPSWAAVEGIVYPPQLSMEQCSSEQTAHYKAEIAARLITSPQGGFMADLTGGFGVDFAQMAQHFAHAVYIEQNAQLCAIASENFRLLGLRNAEVVCGDGCDYLRQSPPLDLVYIDPARRDIHGRRAYSIADCTPNVLDLRSLLAGKARHVMLKLSPMLDWRKAVSDLGHDWVREVHIVSVANECKELLIVMGEGQGLRLICVNDDSRYEISIPPHPSDEGDQRRSFFLPSERWGRVGQEGGFLYEPNASVMKAGCFDALSRDFDVIQLAPNSHLFVSDKPVGNFPGRAFAIRAVTTMNKRELRAALDGLAQANIAVRNFPMTVNELRRRLKLGDGGSTYLFATTLASGIHVLIFCSK